MAEVATPLDSINKEEAPAVEVAAKEAEAVDAVDAAPVCVVNFLNSKIVIFDEIYFILLFATKYL